MTTARSVAPSAVSTPVRVTGRGSIAFSRLCAIEPAAFARDHWDTGPLLTRAADLPAGFGDVFSAAAVDSLVAGRALRQPFFRLVQDGKTVPGATRSAVAGSRTIHDLADPDVVTASFGGGATLVLQSLHRLWPAVGDLCRELAAELGHQTQCNAYITPAGRSRGFDFHHDTHDVFVLQVEGTKRWQIHPPVLDLPTRSQPRAGAGLVAAGAAPLLDVVLRPGDTLYLPRGFIHAAETTDEPSIHLTIGVVVTTWLDVLRDAVNSLGPDEIALRRALPPAFGVPAGAPRVAADALKLATDWLVSIEPGGVAGLVQRRLDKATSPEPVGPLAQAAAAAALAPDSPVRPRRGAGATLRERDGRALVAVAGRTVDLPGVAARMLRAALAGPSTPAGVVSGDPHCEVADALVVVRRLLREGVLVAGR